MRLGQLLSHELGVQRLTVAAKHKHATAKLCHSSRNMSVSQLSRTIEGSLRRLVKLVIARGHRHKKKISLPLVWSSVSFLSLCLYLFFLSLSVSLLCLCFSVFFSIPAFYLRSLFFFVFPPLFLLFSPFVYLSFFFFTLCLFFFSQCFSFSRCLLRFSPFFFSTLSSVLDFICSLLSSLVSEIKGDLAPRARSIVQTDRANGPKDIIVADMLKESCQLRRYMGSQTWFLFDSPA